MIKKKCNKIATDYFERSAMQAYFQGHFFLAIKMQTKMLPGRPHQIFVSFPLFFPLLASLHMLCNSIHRKNSSGYSPAHRHTAFGCINAFWRGNLGQAKQHTCARTRTNKPHSCHAHVCISQPIPPCSNPNVCNCPNSAVCHLNCLHP